jgi:cytochrome c oxidase subunit 3
MSSNPGSLLAEQFDDLDQQRGAGRLGMWIFLATELMLFGGMFTGYFAYRCWYAYDFEAASRHLNVLIGAINTVVLLASSLTMALSVHAARVGSRRLPLYLALTAALGVTFLVFKAIEYYTDYRDNLVPGTTHFDPAEWTALDPPVSPARVELFLMFYYIMTGIHAVHLTVGIGLVCWLWARAVQHLIPPEGYMPVENIGLYWHFVDIVWIFLLPLLYLIGRHSLDDLHF